MRKRLLAGLIIVMLLMQTTLTFAKTDGERLKDLNLINGNAEGDLREYDTLNRAELATILCQLNMVMDEAATFTEDMGYTDIPANEWYYGYVNYAISQGWLRGVSDTKFDPNGIVSEEMVAIVLLRVLGYDPVWGESTLFASGVGINGYAYYPDEIQRYEVFEYIYDALGTRMNNSETTLAEEIGVELPSIIDNLLIETYNYDDGTYSYTDVLGNPVEWSYGYDDGPYKTIEYIDGLYYYQMSDGTLIDEVGYPYYSGLDFEVTEDDYTYTDYYEVYYTDAEYVVLDWNYEVYERGTLPAIEGYTLSEFHTDFYVYVSDVDYTEILVDLDGNVLVNKETLGIPEDGYIVFYEIEGQYVNAYGYIYNLETGETTYKDCIYDVVNKKFIKICDEVFTYSLLGGDEIMITYGNTTELLNLVTGESTEKVHAREISYVYFEKNAMYGTLDYVVDYSSNEIQSSVAIIDRDMNIIYYTEDLSYYGMQVVNDQYIIFNDENWENYGLMDITGQVLLAPTYYSMYVYYGGELECVVDDTYETFEYYDLNNNLEPIYYDYEQDFEPYVTTIFPNGNKLIANYDTTDYVDADGNRIIEEDLVYLYYIGDIDCLYGSNMDYNNVLYSMDGELLQIYEGFRSSYHLDDGIFVFVDGEYKYLGDKDGKLLYGPFDSEVYIVDTTYYE